MIKFIHEIKLKVRDYECDLQGIVNNANYQHYTEHARHEFLQANGVSFADLHSRGIDAVVSHIQMDFKTPLRSGDEFICRLYIKRDGPRYVFMQNIYRAYDEKLVIRSRIDCVCVVDGLLVATCPELDDKLSKYMQIEC